MLRPADAERITGYHVGGISPFGQRRPVRVLVDRSALTQAAVFINGGQRGVQIRLSPHALVAALGAEPADLT
jgi:Cys-tRNA(Pro)/Cys-tRNA(Cys) deacylase